MSVLTVSPKSLRTAYYDKSYGWHDTTTHAYQGCWNNNGSRVGVMLFDDLGTTLKGARIKSIEMSVTIDGGTNKAGRTLTFYTSNYQLIDTSISGSKYPGNLLGTITGDAGKGNHTYILNSETNSSLFRALASYLTDGNTCILLFNGETSNASGYEYSTNFLALTAITLKIEYELGSIVQCKNNGQVINCEVYCKNNGSAVKCQLYYNNNGTAVKI